LSDRATAIGRARPANSTRLSLAFGAIALLHLIGWGTLAISTATQSHAQNGATGAISLGTGLIAYFLGMRHAYDVDHIAAIDNTTRKFLSEGGRPHTLGLFFSLGHSTVVLAVSGLLVFGVSNLGNALINENSDLHKLGATIGGSVAGLFLVLIALFNLSILFEIGGAAGRLRKKIDIDHKRLDELSNNLGFLNRLIKPSGRAIDKPWKMYPLGLLFGLGLDTATSIAMLSIAGSAALVTQSAFAMLALPIIFTSGMALGDTINSLVMTKAYNWAMDKPARRITYNLVVTSASIAIALAVGVPLVWEQAAKFL
jgi:high-affinity nickel-transport protein